MTILEVKDLSKSYMVGDTKVTALDRVSFSVQRGEFVAIVGASGSGKSTLMHLIGGVDRPDSGRIFIEGNDICALSENELAIFRRRHIGIVYQFYNLIPSLNVEENITLPQLLDRRVADPVRLHSIVQTIGLSERIAHYPTELSGGQQQRVAVGRALINEPALILADEPTGNLDSSSSWDVISLLKSSNVRNKQTLILITHDASIAACASRVITIGDGRIVSDVANNPAGGSEAAAALSVPPSGKAVDTLAAAVTGAAATEGQV